MAELWREVVGYSGYEVSDRGRVRSWKQRSRWATRRKEPRILAPSLTRGYPTVKLSGGSVATIKRTYIHRLVLEAFVGPCPPNAEACHNNGDPTGNRVANLRWDSAKNNMADQLQHGTRPRGTLNGQAKLSEEDVRNIRDDPRSQGSIAADYEIVQAHVSRIKSRTTWAWLTG